MLSIKYFLNFRSLVVHNLEYLDVVIEDKILLIISWRFKRPYLLSAPAFNKRYYRRESAIILKVPQKSEVIDIVISSFWRKIKLRLKLKKLKLDAKTSNLLIHQFKPLKMPAFELADIILERSYPVTKKLDPVFKKLQPGINKMEIALRSESFNYQ